jgi:hypothetical protein
MGGIPEDITTAAALSHGHGPRELSREGRDETRGCRVFFLRAHFWAL